MSDSLKEKLLQCYNRGCGQTFESSKNMPESCTHHPGYPVFHDAYKGWSCCNKKTTDFTEFLNIKGCTNSYHSNVKPPELEKPKTKENDVNKDEVYSYKAPQPTKPREITERPSVNEPMKRLSSSIGSSLKPILEKLQKGNEEETELENSAVVPLNTPCKNGGCKETYKGEISSHETCVYHPGVPVFHEGLKYWTCCVKRTTDFDSFLEQVGCTTGNHLWFKKKSDEEKKTPCRYDWHQTGNTIVISIYSKCPLPDSSYVEANSVKLCMNIAFEGGKKLFNLKLILFGVIDVDKSSVTYLGSKVEIKLKKAELVSWKDLTIPIKCLESCVDATDDIDELDISND